MSSKYNSHVILPEVILNGFSYKTLEGKKIKYFDFYEQKVSEEKAKDFNTMPNYFSEQMETRLSKKETNIGKYRKILDDFRKSKFQQYELDGKIIFDLFNLQVIRHPYLLKTANKTSLTSSVFGDFSPDWAVNTALEMKMEIFNQHDFDPAILINKSNNGLVTNSMGLYSAYSKKREVIIMPLNSKVALVLFSKVAKIPYSYWNVDDNAEVLKLNEYAYYHKIENSNKIIGAEKDLVELIKYLNDKKDK